MSILFATLVLLIAPHVSKSYVNPAFDCDYPNYHNETGFTDECWVDDYFTSDICNGAGFCSTVNEDGSSTQCQCYFGFSGDSCEVFLKKSACEEIDCGFTRVQGECVMGKDESAICYCFPGWEGHDCSEQQDFSEEDVCSGIMCNNHGSCREIISDSGNPKWTCECYEGWGGILCDTILEGCSAPFLLDIFSRLAVETGDLLSAAECGYSKPIIFSGDEGAISDKNYWPFCICATLWVEFLNDDYEHMLQTCTMDDYRKFPFYEESMTYCPACNEDQDAIMESLLITKSDVCWHFISLRLNMSVYWRSKWKCSCVEDLGTLSTTQAILTCPFTKHASINDYICFENCAFGKICDWADMYRYFEEELSLIDLETSVLCKDMMEGWVFSVPETTRFEWMEDTFCPCLDALKAIGDEFDSILDCISVTFHQLTMLDLYNQICYDKLIANTACLNSIGWVAVQLAAKNYTSASSCYSAIELSSTMTTLSENLEELMCQCFVPLFSGAISIDVNVEAAIECIGDEFAMNVCDCPDYVGTECYGIPNLTALLMLYPST